MLEVGGSFSVFVWPAILSNTGPSSEKDGSVVARMSWELPLGSVYVAVISRLLAPISKPGS